MPEVDKLWEMLVTQQQTLAINQQAIVTLQENYRDEQRRSQERAEDVTAALLTLSRKQEQMSNILERARGGWTMLIIIGTLGATLVGAGAWLWVNVFHHAPR